MPLTIIFEPLKKESVTYASSGEGNGSPLQYSGLENSMDCKSPWGRTELDMTERLSL